MGVMLGVMRNSGLDERFMFFVTATMALSVLVFGAFAAAVLLLKGDPEAALGALIPTPSGAGMVFGPMLVIGFLVSIPSFAIVWRLAGGESALSVSAEYAGVATAGVASFFWVALLGIVNGDGAEIVVGMAGLAAVLLAPWVARRAYDDRPTHAPPSAQPRIA